MRKIILLFLFTQMMFSQSNAVTLEDKIYYAIDVFVVNPSEENFKKLEALEKTFHPKSKAEILALVILKSNKAYYQNQFGFTNKAISSYENAWKLFQKNKLSDYDITEFCLKPLGNLYTIIGDYDNAENTIKQYFYIANVEKNQAQKHAAILNLSNVYQNSGRINQAIDLLEKTIKTEGLTATQKGVLLNNLGNNYFLNTKSDKAESSYLQSISLLKSDKSQIETLSNAYRNLSKLNLYSDVKLADSYFEKARDEFNKLSNLEPRKKAQFSIEEANLLFKEGKISEADIKIKDAFTILIPYFNKSKGNLPNKNSLYAETTLLDALDLQAELFLAQNQPKKALESYQLSFHIEELFQSLLVYENSKIISQIRNRNRTEKCLDIYYSLYQKEEKVIYLESAFVLQEQTKSAVLRQTISKNKTISREEKLILEQLQNWNTIISKEQQKLDSADISVINNAIKKQNELMLLLKSKTSEKSKESKIVDINDLFLKLKKDKAALVEYFYGQNRLYSFTLENEKIKLDFIKNDENSIKTIRSFIDYFSDSEKITNHVSDYNHDGFLVYKMLKLPAKSTYKNLIIIPDGILTFLPFEALITKESRTTNFAKMNYLLNDFTIGYNNSASFYLNSVPFKFDKETVLGVFPIFEKTNLELAFSKKEMEAIQEKFDGNYLSKTEATFKNFSTNAQNYSILHLSTHADSGDIIDQANIKFYNSEILYSELYNLEINPNLVVLSACETGIGKLYKAEGAMSIARGFQFAGAQNLLFSLWKVNDFTTSILMEKFYSNIKSGKSYYEATNKAKLDFLSDESIPNAKKSPYYWSAFVYYGTLETNSNGNYFIWFSILGSAIALLLLFKIFKKWKNSKRL
ncbi:CHAT domain-containing protein [Flavobacterium sp.]|uniref:CHAT domain-containing protein n=1 Tax=Flavobacterium sp. TaxID=239 RepID=UPI00260896FA|nr:CHAT domain-containing protein [Flavobacterium sp.]